MRVSLFILVITGMLFLGGCSLFGEDEEPPTVPGKIVFSMFESSEGDIEIFSMNTNGSGLKKLTSFDEEGSFEPSWSPDGTQIVFSTSLMGFVGVPTVHLMNADGSNKRPMKVLPERPDIAYLGSNPVWSPDGSKIAYEVCTNCGGAGGSNFELFVYDFATDSILSVTNNYWRDRRPAWSPDGTKLAFSTETPYVATGLSTFQRDIYTITLETWELTRITETGNASAANWSPDGRFIAYQTSVGGEQAYIYDFETDQTTLLLPNFKTSYGVQWSKQGTMISVNISENQDLAEEIRYYTFSNGTIEFIHSEKIDHQIVRGPFKWYYDENE